MKLELDGISVRLAKSLVLQDFSLTIDAPGVTAIMGPSGIGKTTLLRLIAGMIAPTIGTIRVDAKTAVIFQDARLIPWQTAVENAGFGLRAEGIGRAEAKRAAGQLLERLGIGQQDQGKYPLQLSGGMRQRVGIARALAVQPELLLMDEPFSNLDIRLRTDMQALVRSLIEERKIAALHVTHDLVEAVTFADRIIVLQGRPPRIVSDLVVTSRPTSMAEAYQLAAELMPPEDKASQLRPGEERLLRNS